MNYALGLSVESSDRVGRVLFRPSNVVTPNAAHSYQRRVGPDYVTQFYTNLAKWRSETAFFSDPTEISSHPSYRALVTSAVFTFPLILAELRREHSALVWVLNDAFRVQPFGDDDAGDVDAMSEAWVTWGENFGRHLSPT